MRQVTASTMWTIAAILFLLAAVLWAVSGNPALVAVGSMGLAALFFALALTMRDYGGPKD